MSSNLASHSTSLRSVLQKLFGTDVNKYLKAFIFSLDKPEQNKYFDTSKLKLPFPYVRVEGRFDSRDETSYVVLTKNPSEDLSVIELICSAEQDSYIEFSLLDDTIRMISTTNAEVIGTASGHRDVYCGPLLLEDNYTRLPDGEKLFIDFTFM